MSVAETFTPSINHYTVLPAATFVGGGFIVGLTEAVYTPTMGLVWAVMPLTAALSFIVGKSFNNNNGTVMLLFLYLH